MTDTNENPIEETTLQDVSESATPDSSDTLAPTPNGAFKKWNRKIHIYLGLYMLLFLWLFSLSGLFMNNPAWFVPENPKPGEMQPNREQRTDQVTLLDTDDRLEKAWDVMEQLDLRGEIYFLRPSPEGTFAFLCMRPNVRNFVNVTVATGETTINHVTPKEGRRFGYIINQMHVFTGNLGERQRDWLPIKIWSFSMDALSVGLIVLVLSSLYMGWISTHRTGVVISFVLGMVVFVYFMWGQAALA
jgi:hypothetical protein